MFGSLKAVAAEESAAQSLSFFVFTAAALVRPHAMPCMILTPWYIGTEKCCIVLVFQLSLCIRLILSKAVKPVYLQGHKLKAAEAEG